MSLVYIKYHDENIFDVDKPKDHSIKREKLKYTSKYRKMVKDEKQARHVIELSDKTKLVTSAIRSNHQTMGYAQTPVDLPCNFLKKHNGVKWQRKNEHKCPPKRGIAPVPHASWQKSDTSHKENEHKTNFVSSNVDWTKNLKSRKPQPCYVDTPKGDRHNLLNSGLVPKYICLKNFAKVPCYLHAQKSFLSKINAKCENMRLEAKKACPRPETYAGVKKLTAEERENILKGLQTNFAELFRIYQSLSLYTDTVAKKLHKSKIENGLRQLEQDIYLIEHNPEIYVSDF